MRTLTTTFKTSLGIVAFAALLTAAPGRAATMSAAYDPSDMLLTSPGESSLSFELDISGFLAGNTINSAQIAIHLTDIDRTGPNNETYRYEIGSVPQIVSCAHGNCVPNPGVTDTIALDAGALGDLAADGKISVVVRAQSGDFMFADALLTAQVPESIQLAGLFPTLTTCRNRQHCSCLAPGSPDWHRVCALGVENRRWAPGLVVRDLSHGKHS